MVGCGGFGAANAGAAIMVRAAAKEPAIVALAKAFLEFIAVSFPWKVGRYGSTTWTRLSPSVGRSGGRRQGSWRPPYFCYARPRRLITRYALTIPGWEQNFSISIKSNCGIAFAAPRAIFHGPPAAYFAFMSFGASQ